MGTVEKRGKNSWRIATQVKVNNEWQWVRMTLRMDPEVPEDVQRRDACRELKKLEDRLAGELDNVPTLSEWSETWLTHHLDLDASPVTVANYRYLLSSRILPTLGDKLLPDLTPAILTDWLHNLRMDSRRTTRLPDDQLKRPRRSGEKLVPKSKQKKPLSAKTAANYYGCMKTMLAAAVRVGYLDYNPMDRVQRPKIRKTKKKALPEAEVIALLKLIMTEADPPLMLAVLLAMLCSLRLGEVCALTYFSVNWHNRTITVDRSLKYTSEDGSFIGTPKSDSGSRVITLPPAMIMILRNAMWADVEAEMTDPKWAGNNRRFIVHGRHGTRVNKDTPSKWFRTFADAHGFPGLTFHGLRHIHASVLLQHNVDIQSISARMGHSDPSITLRAYSDAMQARDLDAALAMDQLLIASGADPTPPPEFPVYDTPDPSLLPS